MKKVLSILLASALAAIPMTVNASAKEADSSCGIADALGNILSGYTYNTESEGRSETGCNITDILGKLTELRCTLTGNCENGSVIIAPSDGCTDNTCGNGYENSADNGECEANSCETETAVPDDIFNKIKEWLGNAGGESDIGNIIIDGGSDTDTDANNNTAVQVPTSDEAAQVIALVNSYRANYGLSALEYDADAAAAAQIRAEETETLFSHTRPNGTRCFTALDEVGASYRGAGENIAMGQSSAQEVMNDWMNSDGHRENILNANFTKIGVGVHKGSDGRYYWAQMFIY